jgi:hypothetical protein
MENLRLPRISSEPGGPTLSRHLEQIVFHPPGHDSQSPDRAERRAAASKSVAATTLQQRLRGTLCEQLPNAVGARVASDGRSDGLVIFDTEMVFNPASQLRVFIQQSAHTAPLMSIDHLQAS